MHLRNLAILGLLFLIAAGKCTAQVQGESYHGHGYAYVAPGGLTAGGNTFKAIALGVGAKHAVQGPGSRRGHRLAGADGKFQKWFGLASFNGAYHFVSSQHERRFVPFVTAGYTRSFANESGANLANYGAGFQYWFKERWAFRVEGRDHLSTSVRLHTRGRSASRSSSASSYNLHSPG